MNVLLPSAGNKVYLARRLRTLLGASGGSLLASDLDAHAPALCAAYRVVALPAFGAADYWVALDRSIAANGIDAILPVRDVELAAWAERAERGELAAKTLLSSAETLRACLDKSQLYRSAQALGVSCPPWRRIASGETVHDLPFPLIVKPLQGSGSRGVAECATPAALASWSSRCAGDFLVQVRRDGIEYSVDCFAAGDGTLESCCVRERVLVRDGQCVSGRPIEDRELVARCRRLAGAFAFRGVVNFQFIRDRADAWLIDVNPRFPGGLEITEAAGFAFVERTLQELGSMVSRATAG